MRFPCPVPGTIDDCRNPAFAHLGTIHPMQMSPDVRYRIAHRIQLQYLIVKP